MKGGSVKHLVLMSVSSLLHKSEKAKLKDIYRKDDLKCSLHLSVQLEIFQFTWLWIKNSDNPSGSAN